MESSSITVGPPIQSESFSTEQNEHDEVGLQPPECWGQGDLFFSPYHDERLEPPDERVERNNKARQICWHCPYRISCVILSLRNKEKWGVWGGWTRPNRRDFRNYLKTNGYDELPFTDTELEWEIVFFEGSDPEANGDGPRPFTWKYGDSGLEEWFSSEPLPEEDDDEVGY